jgi:hypothetical protein
VNLREKEAKRKRGTYVPKGSSGKEAKRIVENAEKGSMQAGPKPLPPPELLEGRAGALPVDEEPRTVEKVFVNYAAVWGKRAASAENEAQLMCGMERDGAAVGSTHHWQESSTEKVAVAFAATAVPLFLGDPPSSSLASFSRRKPLAERDQSANNARRAAAAVPGAPPLQGRAWSEGERKSHQTACLGKRKLTLGEKLDIVRLHESAWPEKKSQVELASMFDKSASAISKMLQPDSVARLKALAASGVYTGLEKRIKKCS